jgi:hypothetical protein
LEYIYLSKEQLTHVKPFLKYFKDNASRKKHRDLAAGALSRLWFMKEDRTNQVVLRKPERDLVAFILEEFPVGTKPFGLDGVQIDMFKREELGNSK